jgi:hypothetical protein
MIPHKRKMVYSYFQSHLHLRLLYADPYFIAKVPGNYIRTNILKRGMFEALKANLLFSDGVLLELVAVGVGHHHINEACGVPLLDMMKKQFACKAEPTAIAHALQMCVL